MSIKYNGKIIAGGYIPKVSSDLEHGIIRIATNEEVRQGRSNDVAITPQQLKNFGGKANLFDTKVLDYVLPYEKSEGWALQGTYVYKTAILNERYGYPTFIDECIKQKNQSVPTEITLGNSTITMYLHDNGHRFYDISDKSVVDTWFNTYGVADFYGIDIENECVFLPRNNYFMQLTTDINKVNDFNEAGLPTLTTNSTGAHTHTRGTMNITGTFYNSNWKQMLNGSSPYASSSGAFTNTNEGGTGGSNWGTNGGIFTFDASRTWSGSTSSNGAHTHTISGTSDTVQPPSSNKLLYYCVGNTISDTSWIDTVTQTANGVQEIEDKKVKSLEDIETVRTNAVAEIETDGLNAINQIETDRVNAINEIEQYREQALTNLTNTKNAGMFALANAGNALRETQITNCIKEIPQRIKYTLENGTLTIKAGSVVIVPYGTENLSATYPVGKTFINDNFKVYDTQYSDGKFFVWAELVSDIVVSPTTTGTLTRFTTLNLTTNTVSSVIQTESGTASTTQSYTYNYTGYYNTSTNLVGYTNNSTTVTYSDVRSLPFMSVVADGTYMYGSIQQVFNGFGYIGHTVWTDKNIKVIIPNGRNEDGSLNNIEFTTSTLSTKTYVPGNIATNVYFGIDINGAITLNGLRKYDEENNIIYNGTNIHTMAECGMVNYNTTCITLFNPKQPFRAVDQNSIRYDSSTSTLYIGV